MTLQYGGGGGLQSVIHSNFELREDGSLELREDTTVELRQSNLTS